MANAAVSYQECPLIPRGHLFSAHDYHHLPAIPRPDDSNQTLTPYTWYKRFLVEGAREHSLPEDYIAELDRIDAVADTDERRDREKRALACHAES